jgi:GNAT superfamily N-acetyltransferase
VDRLREEHRVGLQYLEAATTLLQRNRAAHHSAGLFEAADLQWWWSQTPRATDDLPQLFWFGPDGRPDTAVVATEFRDGVHLDPLFLPDATPALIEHVIARGLDHARSLGIEAVTLEVDQTDDVVRDALIDRGFALQADGVVETWLVASARPEISRLTDGYRLSNRLTTMDGPHHLHHRGRNHPQVGERLQQTSLYRADLDLVVHDSDGEVAAFGLFWYDPTTATGLVEPMRTEDEHQRRGLARHVLTTGIELLARAGAERIKICYEPGNAASSHLYLSAGFVPDRRTDVFSGPTS